MGGERERFDEKKLETFYARLEKPVYNVVYRWLWREEDARDVVQEAFVRLWRMRAYPTSRFNDRSAIYYCAEIRLTPEWNPFARIGWVEKYLGVAWWQWVVFTEVGRVAPSWSFSELHSHMKFDLGAGVRAMVKGLVVRIDLAGSSESWNVSMMVSQPFQW